MPPRNQPPDHLPRDVRDHPAVIIACRERDIGKLFRIINNLTSKPTQFTPSHIARRCELTPTRVGEYMNGQRRAMSVEVITRVADALRIPGARFGLSPRPWERALQAADRAPVSIITDAPSRHSPTQPAAPNLIIRACRQERGWTQRQAANAIADAVSQTTGRARPKGIDAQFISRLERGDIRWPNAAYRAAIRAVYGATTDEQLGLFGIRSPSGEARTTLSPHLDQEEGPHAESQNVERRRFLAASSVAAVDSVLTAPKRVVQALNIVLSEDADTLGVAVDSLNELVAHYSEVLPSSPPTSIYDDLLSVRLYASTLLGRSRLTRHHSDLLIATGWLSNLLAVATSYMGDHGAALVWSTDAERRSNETGHPDLAGWAALNRSMIAYYKGQASRSADLASRGQQSTAVGSVINVKLVAQEMRASAMLGNADGMAQARKRAVSALTRLPADAARSGAFSLAVAEEPPYTATSLLLVGKFDEAASVTRDVIETAYPASVRHRAEKSSNYARTLLILGLAEAGLGRVTEAVIAGRAALEGADVVWPTVVLASKLDHVLMRNFKDAGETAEYHALCSDAANTVPNGSLASGSQLTQRS